MQINPQALDAVVGRLFGDLSAGYGGVMVSLGNRLGLYKAMAGAGPLSSRELAGRFPVRARHASHRSSKGCSSAMVRAAGSCR